MLKLLPTFLLITSLSLNAQEQHIEPNERVEWEGIASLDAGAIGNMAIDYLKNSSSKFRNADLVPLEVRASYRDKRKSLTAIITSRAASTEGKQHPILVTTDDGEAVEHYIIFDIVVVYFDKEGKPRQSEVLGEKFFGSKEELDEYLQNL